MKLAFLVKLHFLCAKKRNFLRCFVQKDKQKAGGKPHGFPPARFIDCFYWTPILACR